MQKIFILIFACFLSCKSNDDNSPIDINEPLYFPPLTGNVWETVSPNDLSWNTNQLQPLLDFVDSAGTKAFLILKNGKIAVEWYGNGSNASDNLVWNSAAKTLTAYTVGIAQEEGFLNINNASKDYLGDNWSSLTTAQETNITVKHHLTMTTGLDYTVPNNSCTQPSDLLYKNEPGTYWYYHNACYRLNFEIVTGATGTEFKDYFNAKLKNRIGMQGTWLTLGCFNLYYSTARSMARFGLLNLNHGVWDTTTILGDTNYLNAMTNTSQNLNKSYGYLWWLSGKDNYKLPSYEETINGEIIPNAPSDMYAALGKDDQKLYVVPSKNLVIVRLGEAANNTPVLGVSGFDNELWGKINLLIE